MNPLRLTIAVSVSAAGWSPGAGGDIDLKRGIKPIPREPKGAAVKLFGLSLVEATA